ncbi:hypothetical protein C0989_008011 [Termitomyces sp. Mn162]|nr:hypothetical protein C0989_008011 [Termitomyces sp. Mn162]KAH0587023.1 hypothetical protein H2248_005842 [Termitomyces sp. 'cryptogamus']
MSQFCLHHSEKLSIPRCLNPMFSAMEHLICDYRTYYVYPLISLEITLRPLLGLLEKLVTAKKLTLNLSGYFSQSDVRLLGLVRKTLVRSSCRELVLKYNGGDFIYIYKRRKGFLSSLLIPSHPSTWKNGCVHAKRISREGSSKFTELL